MIYVTKAVEFSAAHRLHNPAFDATTNERMFGKCNNPNGHGHNYRLEVTVQGEPDPKTGMAFDLSKLKKILEDEVMARFDHKNLNLDVRELEGLVSTTENVARVIWKILFSKLGKGTLVRVRIFETPDNIIEYSGVE
jgi:6-pyruvoyltetrahydropterin/6-carboxytetrahydropterin synthase